MNKFLSFILSSERQQDPLRQTENPGHVTFSLSLIGPLTN